MHLLTAITDVGQSVALVAVCVALYYQGKINRVVRTRLELLERQAEE